MEEPGRAGLGRGALGGHVVVPSPSNALIGGGAQQSSPSRRNTDQQTYLLLLLLRSFLFLPIYFLRERPVVGNLGRDTREGQKKEE